MTELSDAPQPRTVLYNRGCPIPRGEVIRGVIAQGRKTEMAQSHGWNLWQFSLRTTLVFTFLVAVYFSHLARLEADRIQLVREIEEAGGNVMIDETVFSIFPMERVTAVSLPHDCIQQIGARRLMALPKLATLSLTDFNVTNDAGTSLRASELQFTKITMPLLESLDSNAKRER